MDRAHRWTDEQIEALERRMSREYGTAVREMRSKLKRHLAEYEEGLAKRTAELDGTPEARRALEAWKRDQAMDRRYLEGMVDSLAGDATEATQRAVAIAEDRLPGIYAENANWAAFEVDRAARVDTAFNLQDESTVRELMGRGERLFEPPRPNAAKVRAWTEQKLTAAVTQGILQGESIPHIADRMAEVYGSDRAAAVRAARTACTGAENAGRVSSYERAKRLGIGLRQEWLATLDTRTRDSHRVLDGERVVVGEEFSNGLRFPGDPQGPAREVYNCRCTLVAAVDGIDQSDAERFNNLPDGTTYEEWKEQARARMAGQQVGEPDVIRALERHVVEGKDILGTWQRRPDEFDFEIEDVLDAQGFDGLPRVVDADEFDRAVRAANNGDGLVMQRTYSAPDQAKLDAYRKQLYDGKWYVDCSVNGSTYGRGMYATPDWHGVESEGLRQAADFYSRFNASNGLSYSNTEMMTLDRSARIVDYSDVKRKFDAYRAGVEAASTGASQELREEASESFLKSLIRSTDIEPDKYDDALYFLKANTGRVQGDWDRMSKAANSLGGDGRQAVIELQQRAAMEEHDFVEKYVSEHAGGGGVEDVGSYAASLGYDAIRADQGVGGGEIVVLNRTKLVIRRPE